MDDDDRERLIGGPNSEDDSRSEPGDFVRRRERITFEDAITKTGYGKFHHLLLLICGFALSSEAVEIVSVSYALPPATCEYKTTSVQNGYFTSVIFIGMMVGGLVWGNLADLLGRRSVLVVSLAVNGGFALASSLAQSFYQFLIFRFFSGVGVGGSLPVIFSYYSEFQSKNRRGFVVSLLASFWMCGTIVAAGLAWLVIPMALQYSGWFVYNSWHLYLTLCTIPSLSSSIIFLLMPESPKYLVETGRAEDAYSVLQKMFCVNNPDKMESDFQVSRFYWVASHTGHSQRPVSMGLVSGGFFKRFVKGTTEMLLSWSKLFAKSRMRVTLLTIAICLTISFSYYGLFMWLPQLFERFSEAGDSGVSVCSWSNKSQTINSSQTKCNPSADVYRNGLITSLASLPGNLFSVLLVDYIGRKPLLAGSMALSGASVFFIWLVNSSTNFLIISCLFTGISAISWNVLDIVTVELYPTALRSTANGFLQALSRVAAIGGNLVFAALIDAHCIIPLTIVAALLVAGAIFSLMLPETKRVELE